jgi:hypothetical protein
MIEFRQRGLLMVVISAETRSAAFSVREVSRRVLCGAGFQPIQFRLDLGLRARPVRDIQHIGYGTLRRRYEWLLDRLRAGFW